MKEAYFVIFIVLVSINPMQAQLSVNADGSDPANSAMLEIKSTTRGFLLPRMNTTQQISIPNPAQGLLVFNTDSLAFYYFDGAHWLELTINPSDSLLPWNSCGDDLLYYGQIYATVQIGSQCWMAENLNYETGNSWCYDENPVNCDTYGRMYDRETALHVCPSGWRLPSDEDWKILEGFADTQFAIGNPEWDNLGWRGYDAGERLKSTSGWFNNQNGTDYFGFTVLPGGFRTSEGTFQEAGSYARFWTNTDPFYLWSWYRKFGYDHDDIERFPYPWDHGYSVRCLKN